MKKVVLLSLIAFVARTSAAADLSCTLVSVVNSQTKNLIARGRIKEVGTVNSYPWITQVGKNLRVEVFVDKQGRTYLGTLTLKQQQAQNHVRFVTQVRVARLPVRFAAGVLDSSGSNDDLQSGDFEVECR